MRKNEKKYEQVENPEQIADTLGISAVMVQDMKGKRINGYTFDINVRSFHILYQFCSRPIIRTR
jgi:arginyl-tRNA synthetase